MKCCGRRSPGREMLATPCCGPNLAGYLGRAGDEAQWDRKYASTAEFAPAEKDGEIQLRQIFRSHHTQGGRLGRLGELAGGFVGRSANEPAREESAKGGNLRVLNEIG